MRSFLSKASVYALGLVILVLSVEGELLAAVSVNVPEIDGASISAGLGVLAAGVLILRARRGSK